MQNQIAQFTNEQLIAELQRRHFRTELLFGIEDIDAALGDDEDKLTMEEKIKVLQNLDTDSAQEGIYHQIMEELAPIIFG